MHGKRLSDLADLLNIAFLLQTGVRFRVTEEYDEDSPFSRPPNPRQEAPPPAEQASPSESDPRKPPSDASPPSTADTTDNGSQPAGGTHTPTHNPGAESQSVSQHMSETEDRLQESALSSITEPQSMPSVGRGQVYSNEADTPEQLPAHIEVAGHPDSDQPTSTEQMDTVHQKPGVRRTLDGSGHVAPDRDAGQQGLTPPQGSPQGDPVASEGSIQARPWWEPGVTAVMAAIASVSDGVSGAADTVKGAVSGGYQAFSKGGQQSGDRCY